MGDTAWILFCVICKKNLINLYLKTLKIYVCLQTVMSDHSLDINVRWIAVLYMKNGIDKYWRKNAPK